MKLPTSKLAGALQLRGGCGSEIALNYILSLLHKFQANSLKFASRTGLWNCGILVAWMTLRKGYFCSLCWGSHDMSAAHQGLAVTKGVTSWNHSCSLYKGLSEETNSTHNLHPAKGGKGGQGSSRHRCVGAGASQLSPPSPWVTC